jgi:hypothetical protein
MVPNTNAAGRFTAEDDGGGGPKVVLGLQVGHDGVKDVFAGKGDVPRVGAGLVAGAPMQICAGAGGGGEGECERERGREGGRERESVCV